MTETSQWHAVASFIERWTLRAAVVVAVLVILAGCGRNQTTRDLENVPAKNPDKAEVYVNVDQFANIVRLCIDGVAFATTTKDYQPLMRVPEWDSSWCQS